MPFPNPPANERAAWVEQYFINQWEALEAIYDEIVAGAAGGATEATLAAFKTENNDNLIDAIALLTVIESNLDTVITNTNGTGGSSIAQWLQGIFTNTSSIDTTANRISRGYYIPGSVTAEFHAFASSGSAVQQDEVDEVALQINTLLTAMIGANKMYSGGDISICSYLDGAVVKYIATASIIING